MAPTSGLLLPSPRGRGPRRNSLTPTPSGSTETSLQRKFPGTKNGQRTHRGRSAGIDCHQANRPSAFGRNNRRPAPRITADPFHLSIVPVTLGVLLRASNKRTTRTHPLSQTRIIRQCLPRHRSALERRSTCHSHDHPRPTAGREGSVTGTETGNDRSPRNGETGRRAVRWSWTPGRSDSGSPARGDTADAVCGRRRVCPPVRGRRPGTVGTPGTAGGTSGVGAWGVVVLVELPVRSWSPRTSLRRSCSTRSVLVPRPDQGARVTGPQTSWTPRTSPRLVPVVGPGRHGPPVHLTERPVVEGGRPHGPLTERVAYPRRPEEQS